MSIKTRYALVTSALIGLVLALTAAAVIQMQRRILLAQAYQGQETLMEGVARLAQEALAGRDQLMLLSYLQVLQREHPELGPAAVVWGGHTAVLGRPEKDLMTLERRLPDKAAVAAQSPAAEPAGAVIRLAFRKAVTEGAVDRALRPFISTTAALAALAMLAGALGAVLLARLLTRPLMDMAAAVTAVGQGNLEVVLPVRGDDEVAGLSRLFNQMTARLREHNQFKADLLHTLTHELNTPLMGLSSHLEIMKETPAAVQASLSQTAAMMLAAVQRMSEALKNTLQLFSAEHGARKSRSRQLVDAAGMLAEVCRLFAPMAAAKRVALDPPQLPAGGAKLRSDSELLRQILNNLLSNALKYTPEGGRVAAGLQLRTAALVLWVRDSGGGIPQERLSHLFQRFDRSAGAADIQQRVSGVGLGLSIVANAVADLNGKIKVDSEEGKGTTFWVTLPALGGRV
jgi:signal transduction histidine kinase